MEKSKIICTNNNKTHLEAVKWIKGKSLTFSCFAENSREKYAWKKMFCWFHFSLFFEELPQMIRWHKYCGQVRLTKYACAPFSRKINNWPRLRTHFKKECAKLVQNWLDEKNGIKLKGVNDDVWRFPLTARSSLG